MRSEERRTVYHTHGDDASVKTPLFNTAHPLAESGKPIFIPFGEWNYDGQSRQRLDRAHGEKIANELNARVAKGDPGIPVYQGHPDVPALASKYPDKGALGWVTRIELVNEDLRLKIEDSPAGGPKANLKSSIINPQFQGGLALTVEWDRDPSRGFRWFSPYWLANSRDGGTYIVDEIASIGLVNNPNIPEFRLANKAEDTTKRGDFQFTPAHGRRHVDVAHAPAVAVSIHAHTWRATTFAARPAPPSAVSIHARTWRATAENC